jgi:hypothetical protein
MRELIMARCQSCGTFFIPDEICQKCALNAELGELLARFDDDAVQPGDNLRIMEIEGQLEWLQEQKELDDLTEAHHP